jgi:hypothetical protein
MPPPLQWNPNADGMIHQLRLAGATWDEIAVPLGVSRWSAIARGRRIGALAPERPRALPVDPAREPLGVGHALSWAVLTEGTLLDGTSYPWPPLELQR